MAIVPFFYAKIIIMKKKQRHKINWISVFAFFLWQFLCLVFSILRFCECHICIFILQNCQIQIWLIYLFEIPYLIAIYSVITKQLKIMQQSNQFSRWHCFINDKKINIINCCDDIIRSSIWCEFICQNYEKHLQK